MTACRNLAGFVGKRKKKVVLLEYKINICYLFFPKSSKVLIKKSVMFRPVKSSRVSVVFCTLCQRQQATTVNNNFRPFLFPCMFSKEHLGIREHHNTLFISFSHIQPSCVFDQCVFVVKTAASYSCLKKDSPKIGSLQSLVILRRLLREHVTIHRCLCLSLLRLLLLKRSCYVQLLLSAFGFCRTSSFCCDFFLSFICVFLYLFFCYTLPLDWFCTLLPGIFLLLVCSSLSLSSASLCKFISVPQFPFLNPATDVSYFDFIVWFLSHSLPPFSALILKQKLIYFVLHKKLVTPTVVFQQFPVYD